MWPKPHVKKEHQDEDAEEPQEEEAGKEAETIEMANSKVGEQIHQEEAAADGDQKSDGAQAEKEADDKC